MKNPNWHRDELILALDLYFQEDRGNITSINPKIIELSKLLKELPIHEKIPNPETFRSANSVSLKLSNFQAIDPSYTGAGMSSYSKLDKNIFFEFCNDKALLTTTASKIKSTIGYSNLNNIENNYSSLTDE